MDARTYILGHALALDYFRIKFISSAEVSELDIKLLQRKNADTTSYSGVETRLSLTLSANRLQLQKFVEVTSTNAAKLYGLYPRKGALIAGESDADLTIWYPEGMKEFELTNSMLHHNVDYTPYEGRTMKQWPRYTVLRGEVVWARDEGGLIGKKGYGEFLKRDVSSLAGCRSEEWDVENF